MTDHTENAQNASDTRPPRNPIKRWSVPVVLVIGLSIVAIDEWHDLQRFTFAQRVASVAKQNEHSTLSLLIKALKEDIAGVLPVAPPGSRPDETGIVIVFPSWTWLRLCVTADSRSDQITELKLLYFSSENVSLDCPQENLPNPGPRLALSLALTGLGYGLWKAVANSERAPARPLRTTAAVCAALCVLAQAFLAAIGCIRLCI